MDTREADRRTLAPGGSVLEMGCGPGRSALELERRGLTVHRTDATVAFVERLRALAHAADVLFADTVLSHPSREDLAAVLQRATTAVRYLAFTVRDGDGEAWTTRESDAPRLTVLAERA